MNQAPLNIANFLFRAESLMLRELPALLQELPDHHLNELVETFCNDHALSDEYLELNHQAHQEAQRRSRGDRK